MHVRQLVGVIFGLVVTSTAFAAGPYDGSKPFLCAAITILECGDTGECQRRTPESVNLPPLIKIDAEKKWLSSANQNGVSSPIERVEHFDGHLLLQGGENGRGWSAVVTEETGKLSASVTAPMVSFAIFGACTVP
jgi:hypothetical protein